MSTKAKTAVFTTGICVVAVALFGAIAIASHAEAETAGCSAKKAGLGMWDLVFDSPGKDPCTTDGIWEVPDRIRPGTYRVTPTGVLGFGDWTMCEISACWIGGRSVIDYKYVTGPDTLMIPKNAKYINTSGIRLEPVN